MKNQDLRTLAERLLKNPREHRRIVDPNAELLAANVIRLLDENERYEELKRSAENLLGSLWEIEDRYEPIYASYGANFDSVRSAITEETVEG